jgi:hypothetical protein
MFTYKSEAELQAMTPEQRNQYATDKRTHETAETKAAIEAATKDYAKNGDVIAAVSKAVDTLKASLTAEGITKEVVSELREQIAQLKETPSFTGKKDGLAKEIKASKEAIKAIAHGQRDGNEIELKTLVLRTAIGDNAQAYEVPDIGQLAHRKLVLYDLFPKITLGTNNNGTVRYYDWDAATAARAAAMVAEGAAFPESTAKWQKYTLDLKKVGDSITVTDEFFEDEEMFASELGMFLQTNVAIVIDTQLATGDGTGQNLTGITTSATAYTAVAAAIQSPTIYDLIEKMSETITSSYGSKYSPNFALMNITDINKMKLSKDQNDNYILPPFVSRDGKQVGTITIVECNAITANTMVLGDNRYARIYEKAGMVVQKGFVNAQFIEDENTLKVRKRLLFLIRTVDKTGFLYCSSITNALVTLAS